jgi:hypothetical protein
MMHRPKRSVSRFAIVVLAIAIAGCAAAKLPIQQTSQVVASPVQGELSVVADKKPVVGELTPVTISIANGTGITLPDLG